MRSISRLTSSAWSGGSCAPSTAFTYTTDKNVLAANALGIINGVGNNRFDPNGVLTTEQAIVMAQRALEALANS